MSKTHTNPTTTRPEEVTEMKQTHELQVGDSVRHYDFTGDDDFRTVFHIEHIKRNLFGVIDLQIMVGVTNYPDLASDHELRQHDIYVGCLPDTGWDSK